MIDEKEVTAYVTIPDCFLQGCSEDIVIFRADGGNHFTDYGIYEGMFLFFDRKKRFKKGRLSCYINTAGDDRPKYRVSDTHIVRSKSDLNFWGLPSYESIKPFVEQQYDLLIDTIGEENFFSQYVALRTTANLKVVYATPAEDPSEVFDLIIRGDGQVELKGFFNNVIEYLSMIKK